MNRVNGGLQDTLLTYKKIRNLGQLEVSTRSYFSLKAIYTIVSVIQFKLIVKYLL
jgi:hypothetical protein